MSLDLITRDEWGASSKRSTTRLVGRKGIGVHWLGPGIGIKRESQYFGVMRGIERFHEVSRGWSDFAYNWAASPVGQVFQGRGKLIRSAANGTNVGNDNYEAVVYLGGEGDEFTREGKIALRKIIEWRFDDLENVARPHRWFKSTGCPGNKIAEWVADGMPIPGGKAVDLKRPVLRKGMKGAWVRALQRKLRAVGYKGEEVTGRFREDTERRVRDFQKGHDLKVDGIVGDKTWRALTRESD